LNKDLYEHYVRTYGMKPIKKKMFGKWDIYISDGFSKDSGDDIEGPHYKTGFGVAFGGDVKIALHYETQAITGSTLSNRIKDCEAEAHRQITDLEETECLKQ